MGEGHEAGSVGQSVGRPVGQAEAPSASHATRSTYVRSAILLAIAGLSLYLLLPSLLSVFSSWRTLLHLDWRFAAFVLVFECASYVCLWAVDRITIGVNDWFVVACAQLAGNAAGRLIPGSATPLTVVMLGKAGAKEGEAAAGLTASTWLQTSTALALPVLAIPAIIGGAPVNRGLASAAYLGAVIVLLLFGVAALLLRTDAPLRWTGRMIQSLLNATVRRRRPVSGLDQRLLGDRDFARNRLDRHWRSALFAASANTGFDYLALLFAVHAVGADPRPSLVVLAYAAAEVLAQIPFTPGGLGFVESGLVGTLVLAGVPGHAALAATLLYRLVSYWLPILAGGIAYLLFRRRPDDRASAPAAGRVGSVATASPPPRNGPEV
jgi:uncharacterized protein (TIRG00374 family)